MKRKHNPLLSLAALILLAAILALTCIGCEELQAEASETVETVETVEALRFTYEHVSIGNRTSAIITDTETGAQYLLVNSNYGAVLTKLEEVPEE